MPDQQDVDLGGNFFLVKVDKVDEDWMNWISVEYSRYKNICKTNGIVKTAHAIRQLGSRSLPPDGGR